MKNRYAHVDALRAFAVLIVVVGHAGLGHIVPGGSGVTIFFAISGFIITTVLLKEWQKTDGFDLGGFYIRRMVKLLPPLVVVLIIPTLIYSMFAHIDWAAFAGQTFFYFNWMMPNDPDVLPGSGPVWSLSIEEQFYIVFALLWVWLARSRRAVPWLTGVAIATVVGATVLRVMLAEPGNEAVADRIYYGSDTRADSLAWGIIAAVILYRWQQSESDSRWRTLSGTTWALFGAAAIFLASVGLRDEWFQQTFRYTMQSVATCIVILYGMLATSTRVHQWFSSVSNLRIVQTIGLASYSVYLVHLGIVRIVLDHTESLPLPVTAAIAVTLAVAVGVALYWVVEVPARRQYDKLRNRRAARADVRSQDAESPTAAAESAAPRG
ncbi:acyltransferase family protein [Gordonia jinghuaiqii]|uniref:Acyltransferase n=1 Tax=Gordonia jinghuaiqii TaxID=2758710 RepID=A0A7D7R3Y3_9ACTN|nr:acyltransferase [Gordonia jinghuaiqii]MCR5977933.1 acyltransferase family protein [Gordonia jinghuaiqii]QMT02587.1 acyltransferase [Gordonia jinghuaiqii]